MELIFIFSSLIISALLCVVSKRRLFIESVSLAASAITALASILVALRVAYSGEYAHSIFSVDALGAIVMLLVAFVGLASTGYSIFYLRQETAKQIIGFRRVRQYFILLNLFIAAMFFAIVSNSPILTWISIEATTLSTAFLISFYNKPSAIEAAWKYLIINSVGLICGFFGTLLFFASVHASGESSWITWSDLLSRSAYANLSIIRIAFVLVLIGYGTKAGLAPMHTWLPDAHGKAPAPVSALLSGVLLNVSFVTILRFKEIIDAAVGSSLSQNFLIILGLLSIAIATPFILFQDRYKRLLAYSSVENFGIMSLGFGFGGLGIFAAILHMIYHAFLKSALFLLSGNTLLRYYSSKIFKVSGALSVIPATAILFSVGIFAIAGTPPFGTFLTKISILSAGMQTHPVVSIAAIGLFAVVFVGLLKNLGKMMFGEKPEEITLEKENHWLVVWPLILIIFALYLSVHIPPFLLILINRSM